MIDKFVKTKKINTGAGSGSCNGCGSSSGSDFSVGSGSGSDHNYVTNINWVEL